MRIGEPGHPWPPSPKRIATLPDTRMEAVSLHLREANWLVGVAIAGRPVARRLDDGKPLAILRVATDGTPKACSFLYCRCARIARLMGYERVITYTLVGEGGASLRAVGAKPTGPLESHEWGNPNRPRKSQAVYHEPKYRWEL